MTERQTIIDFLVAEAVKTSAIEGEYLSREDVLSSIRNNPGLNRIPEKIKDKRAVGVARLLVSSMVVSPSPLGALEYYRSVGQWQIIFLVYYFSF